jgi:hypothetical protein
MSSTTESVMIDRPIRLLIISQGGPRQAALTQMLQEVGGFATPVFVKGVSSRDLRNRRKFFRICHAAGLLPEAEWEALQPVVCGNDECERPPQAPTTSSPNNSHHNNSGDPFFDCLATVPVAPGRRGAAVDVQLHYAVEVWRKAKTINRGRAVLACSLAHLLALQRFTKAAQSQSTDSCDDNNTDGPFDVLLEDNVRAPVLYGDAARRIRETMLARRAWEAATGQTCHMQYFGWLGSPLNLDWVLQSHLPQRSFVHSTGSNTNDDAPSIAPFPTHEHIQEDLENGTYVVSTTAPSEPLHQSQPKGDESSSSSGPPDPTPTTTKKVHTTPGGTPVWGAYAYWMSPPAYAAVLQVLRTDVGALLWKPKRARYYSVKGIDKILPRHTMAALGPASVQIATRPAFFRAPMLTSQIHAVWDAAFCRSTTVQLRATQLSWADLWLTAMEGAIVDHYERHGTWLTPTELAALGASS